MTTESRIERYYYLKDPANGHYLGCVCLYRDPETGKFSRGISLCNTDEDRFIKARARGIAYSRAVNAPDNNFPFCFRDTFSEAGPRILQKLDLIKDTYKLDLLEGRYIRNAFRDATLTPFECRMWDDVLNPWPEKTAK